MGWKIESAQELEHSIFRLKLNLAQRIGVRSAMTIVDVGCGQGGFTAAASRIAGEHGKVLGIDVSDEYIPLFWENVRKYGLEQVVNFIQADAADLKDIVPVEAAEMVVSYRILEELKNCMDMSKVVKEMAKIAKKDGKVCIIELSTQVKNEAERNYVRLHKESGDCFFEPGEILQVMKDAGLKNAHVETFDTDIWFSPEVAKQDLEFAQVWFDKEVEERLGSMIDTHGMKYPALLMFSGSKEQFRHYYSINLSM